MSNDGLLRINRAIHELSLALWGGGAVFFSYLTTPRIFGFLRDRLPQAPPPGVEGLTAEVGRRLAGDTVGAVFPTYFAAQIVVGLFAAGSGIWLAWHGNKFDKIRAGLVLAAFLIVTVHSLTVYPHSVQILDSHYEKIAAGDMATATALRQSFGAWHGVSQLLNLVTIVQVIVALVMVTASESRHRIGSQEDCLK